MMDRMGLKDGEEIQAGMMTKAIERAQKKVEENNFGIRKRLLEYDDVMNSQRTVIYSRRRNALAGERIDIDRNNIVLDFAETFVENFGEAGFEDFSFELIRQVAVQPSFDEQTFANAKKEELVELIAADINDAYERRAQSVAATAMPVLRQVYEKQGDQVENIYIPITNGKLVYNVPVNLRKAIESDGAEIYKMFTKIVMLTTIDDNWRDHLRQMDDLRQSVQNASYEQKDPLLIYKLESYNLFSAMLEKSNRDELSILNKGYIPMREQTEQSVRQPSRPQQQQNRPKVDMSKLQASRMQAAARQGRATRGLPRPCM